MSSTFLFFSLLSCLLLLSIGLFIWLYQSRNIQPIRCKGPLLLFLTLIGSILLLCLLLSYLLLDMHSLEWIREIGKYAGLILVCVVYVPIGLRAYRVYRIHMGKEDGMDDNKFIGGNVVLSIHEYFLLWVSFCIFAFALTLEVLIEYAVGYSLDYWSLGCFFADDCGKIDDYLIFYMVSSLFYTLVLTCLVLLLRSVPSRFSSSAELQFLLLLSGLAAATYAFLFILHLERSFILYSCVFIEIIRIVGIICASVLEPLLSSCFWPPSVVMFSSCDSLLTLDALLHDFVCMQYFRLWLMKEWNIEVLLAWLELELYRDLSDELFQNECKRLYEKYFKPDAELEIHLQSSLLQSVITAMNSGTCDSGTLGAIQNVLFNALNKQYSNFLASSTCKLLVGHLEREELIEAAMRASDMI